MSPRTAQIAALLLFASACHRAGPELARSSEAPTLTPPARPERCRTVEADADLQKMLEAAAPGDALCLPAGTWTGPFVVPAGVTLWGPREAILHSTGKGTTVRLEGERPRLFGVTVDGSGGRFDTLDAAVKLQATDAVVEGVKVVNATFGILAERSKRLTLRRNHVVGDASSALGLRGDGIRLWETTDSLLEENRVEASRDIVVWYSKNNTLRRNHVTHGRYGTHLMYSHDNVLEANRFVSNEVGVFIMYSRGVMLRGNLLAGGSGAAGMGLGVKESGNVTAVRNTFLHNTVGAYLDSSPIQQDEQNLFEENVFRLGEAGVVFHSSPARNTFKGNSFRDNDSPVRVEGSGDALAIEWQGNDFDDYAGYDLDGDGFGDVPYELRSLSGELVSRYPDLAFFRGSATLALVSAAGEVLPLLTPKTLVRDARPRMEPLAMERTHAN